MWQHRSVESRDRPRPLVAPIGLDTELDAPGEHDLHTHADPQHRPSTGEATPNDLWPTGRGEASHAGFVRSNTGYQKAIGLRASYPIGGDAHSGTDVL